MLTRRLLASAVIGAFILAQGGPAIAGAPVPTDGKVVCTGIRCQLEATSPGTSSAPAPNAAPAAKIVSRPAAPLTPEQQQQAATTARHQDVYCQNATLNGGALPAACQAPPAQPAAPAAAPGDATKKALAQLSLARPAIGSAPCHEADCRGSVGVPVWLWTAPWRSQSATATAGPFTVTATAVPTSVTWDLGDGQQITCQSPGTPYDTSMGWTDSPDCGTRYSRVGDYAITATMTYRVTWAGADSGSQTMATSSSVPVHIGEIQVVATN